MKYRIVELPGGFVPQVKMGWFFPWEGIERDLDTWSTPSIQFRRCKYDTYEEAEDVLNSLKYLQASLRELS